MKKRKIIQFFTLLGSILCLPSAPASSQNWTPVTTFGNSWLGTAASANGQKLFASGFDWSLAVSTDAGSTWTTNTEPQAVVDTIYGSWRAIACSADGNTRVGINFNAYWISTNSGATWFSNNVPNAHFFSSVALSADGTKLVLADGLGDFSNAGLVYISTNSGATVTPVQVPVYNWSGVASSADGTRLYAIAVNFPAGDTYDLPIGYIYASTNSGLNWTPAAAPTNDAYWGGIASSADGSHLVVGGFYNVYTSTNFGCTWTSNNLPTAPWLSVASSADGNRLVAASQYSIFTSTNAGTSWISNNLPVYAWQAVASSADGGVLIAAPSYGTADSENVPVFVSQTTVSPQLNLSVTCTNLTLSWIVPSTNYILQQSADLASWANVSASPVLNLTNLQNQVCLPPANSAVFYRLKTP